MTLHVAFLGGAGAIGASCVAVAGPDGWVVVDAGMTPGEAGGGMRLPRFDMLTGAPIAAIVITHAHGDHCGALPLLAALAPHAPIYAAAATQRLLPLMLGDSLARMQRTHAAGGPPPVWTRRDLNQALARVRPLHPGMLTIVPGAPRTALRASFSGHIVGALAIGVRTPAGSVVVSGDIGAPRQRTAPAPQPPPFIGAALLALEATYGDRNGADRSAEERRFTADVAACLARGGHALIPAFALGRAQEALCILHAAARRGDLPPGTPICIDGLAQRVAATYARQPTGVHPALAALLGDAHADPFRAAPTRAVRSDAQRRAILQGPPAVIIAGSGMLHGGAAAAYADALLDDPRSGIFLVGHLDAASPGAALLAAAADGDGMLHRNGRMQRVRCQVARYALSAHADADALVAYARAAAPHCTALVHGDAAARAALAQRLRAAGMEVILPEDGAIWTPPSRPAAHAAPRARRGAAAP